MHFKSLSMLNVMFGSRVAVCDIIPSWSNNNLEQKLQVSSMCLGHKYLSCKLIT